MKQRKFTLVELMVILSIITILMSVLIPALKQSVLKTEEITCASNFRQIALTFSDYSNDNNSKLPAIEDNIKYQWPGQWFMHLVEYAGYEEWGPEVIAPNIWARWPSELTPNIFACPSAVSGVNSWQYGNNIQLGVGMNGYLYAEALDPDNPPSSPDTTKYPKVHAISNPSAKLLITDAWGYYLNNYWCLSTNQQESRPDNVLNRTRHDGSCNVLFVDGHVESATDEEVVERIYDDNSIRRDKLYHIW